MTIKIDFEGVKWVECSKVQEFISELQVRIFNKKGEFSCTPDCANRIMIVCAEELLGEDVEEITTKTEKSNSRTEPSSEGNCAPLSKPDSAPQRGEK